MRAKISLLMLMFLCSVDGLCTGHEREPKILAGI